MELLNEVLKELQPILNEGLTIVLGFVVAYLGVMANQVKNKWIADRDYKYTVAEQERQDAIIRKIVLDAIYWVEQITGVDLAYESLEKLKLAKDRIALLLSQLGIEASEEYIDTLIESFLNEFNKDKQVVSDLEGDNDSYIKKIMGEDK